MGQRFAKNRGAAFTWSHQSEQQANGGRLPGTIGADKASDGPGRDADGEAIDGLALPKVLAQTMSFDRQGAARRIIRRELGTLRGIRGGSHDHLHERSSCRGGLRDIVSWCTVFPFSFFSLNGCSFSPHVVWPVGLNLRQNQSVRIY